jgi:hypothetical protein
MLLWRVLRLHNREVLCSNLGLNTSYPKVSSSRLGGVVVSVLATGHKGRGF